MASKDQECEGDCKIEECKDDTLLWLQCEECDKWWHCFCADIPNEQCELIKFICNTCKRKSMSEPKEKDTKTDNQNVHEIKQVGFHRSLESLPDFRQEHLCEYLKSKGPGIKDEKDGVFEREYKRGYKFFVEGYLHGIKCKESEEDFMCVCKCFRSMRKSEKPHSITIVLCRNTSKVQFAKCSCKAGLSEACNHIVALLHYLCHVSALGLSEIPDDPSCTSLPQKWHTPRGKQIEAKPVRSVEIKKPIYGKAKAGLKCLLYDPRPSTMRHIDEDALLQLKNNMENNVSNCVFPHLFSNISYTVRGSYAIPSGSVLSYHNFTSTLSKQSDQSTLSANFPLPVMNQASIEIKAPNLSPKESALETIKIDLQNCIAIEEQTREQSDSDSWRKERVKRLTSSNFGKILKRKKEDVTKICAEMMNPDPFKGKRLPKALEHGKACEPHATIAFENSRNALGKPVTTNKCGLVVHPQCPWLAASPDRKVHDPTLTPPCGLLEIKSPLSGYGQNVKDLCKNNKFCCELFDNKVLLKKNHDYYIQIQGQLACTGLHWCYLYVYTGENAESSTQLIWRDDTFINGSLLPILSNFYFNKYLKCIVQSKGQQDD